MKLIKKVAVRSSKGKVLAKAHNISFECFVDILKTLGYTAWGIEEAWGVDLTFLNKVILNGVYSKYQKEKLEVKEIKYDGCLTIHWVDKNGIQNTQKGALILYIGEYDSRYYTFVYPQTYGIDWALTRKELE